MKEKYQIRSQGSNLTKYLAEQESMNTGRSFFGCVFHFFDTSYHPSTKDEIIINSQKKRFISSGNVKKCAVGKHPKSEKHGNTAQISEVERSGTQENCGGIGSGCRLRLRPLPVLHRRQSQWVARIDPNAVVVDKNIAENDRFDLFSR